MNKIFMQFKREFWEFRSSLVVTPFVLGGILVGLLLLGIVPLQSKIVGALPDFHVQFELEKGDDSKIVEHLSQQGDLKAISRELLTHGLTGIYSLFSIILLFTLAGYFMAALYNDRRDRSILFWKSLPVPEWRNVLVKLGSGALGAPLVYAAAAMVTGALTLLIIVTYAGVIWHIPVPGFFALVGTFLSSGIGLLLGWLLLALWYLPVFCWLLLCSAIARKASSVIAFGVPFGLIVLEAWTLGSSQLAQLLKAPLRAGAGAFQQMIHDPSQLGHLLALAVGSPAMWVGLIISVALLATCVWLRSFRYEI